MREFFYRHSRGITRVIVGRDIDIGRLIRGRAVYLIDEKSNFKAEGDSLVLSGGEEIKGLDTLTKVYQYLASRGVDRATYLVAVGGGALLDLATFAAGTYMRGIGLVLVPTTLLSMVDASIGGKGAVDWGYVKNLIGVIYQPDLIISDLRFVSSTPENVYRSAFAEVVKYGVVLDRGLFEYLRGHRAELLSRDAGALEEVVFRSAQIKSSVVEIDEFETKNIRQVLNFGHTVGHALERVLNLLHGEAVSLGMIAEGKMAVEMGYFKESHLGQLAELLEGFGLPVKTCLSGDSYKRARELVLFDKKRRGDKILMPLPVGLGKWVLEEVPLEYAERGLDQFKCSA